MNEFENFNLAINPDTGNPTSRTTPDHHIRDIYARNGMVVVVGRVGDTDTESPITTREALDRAKAINEMAKKAQYTSDHESCLAIVEKFISAIAKAKEQIGRKSASVSVSMCVASTANKIASRPEPTIRSSGSVKATVARKPIIEL